MREYDVEVCSEECGMLVVAPSYDMRYRGVMWTYMENPVGAELRYCPFCGTRVGVERRANGSISWREAMVPRAALEWLAGISEGCAQVSPCPANKPLSDANKEALCRECLVQAALKAAEEASDGD